MPSPDAYQPSSLPLAVQLENMRQARSLLQRTSFDAIAFDNASPSVQIQMFQDDSGLLFDPSEGAPELQVCHWCGRPFQYLQSDEFGGHSCLPVKEIGD